MMSWIHSLRWFASLGSSLVRPLRGLTGGQRIGAFALAIVAVATALYFQYRSPRLVMLVVGGGVLCLVLWWAIEVWARRRRRGRDQAFEKGIVDAEAVQALRESWKKASERLRTTGTRREEMDFYVLMGEPSSGKSTMLRKSGLDLPLGSSGLSGLAGTRNCDWWFTDEAIILDTAGRLSFQEHATDSEEWKTFLELLRRYRPQCPINGAIVSIPCTSLVNDSPDEHRRKAQVLRAALSELEQGLQISFPVYVFLTKCDRLLGFSEFFSRLSREENRQMLGWARPTARMRDPVTVDEVGAAVDDVTDRLRRWRLRLLNDPVVASSQDMVNRLFAFPEEFSKLKAPLERYLSAMFPPGKLLDPLGFRGFLVTSGSQKETPLSLAAKEMLGGEDFEASEGYDLVTLFGQQERAFFISDSYTKKIFAERGLIRPTRLRERRVRRTRRGFYAAAAVLLLGSTLSLMWWFHGHQQDADIVRAAVDATEGVPGDSFVNGLDRAISGLLELEAQASGGVIARVDEGDLLRGIGFLRIGDGQRERILRDLQRLWIHRYQEQVLRPLEVQVRTLFEKCAVETGGLPDLEAFDRVARALRAYEDVAAGRDYRIGPLLDLTLKDAGDKALRARLEASATVYARLLPVVRAASSEIEPAEEDPAEAILDAEREHWSHVGPANVFSAERLVEVGSKVLVRLRSALTDVLSTPAEASPLEPQSSDKIPNEVQKLVSIRYMMVAIARCEALRNARAALMEAGQHLIDRRFDSVGFDEWNKRVTQFNEATELHVRLGTIVQPKPAFDVLVTEVWEQRVRRILEPVVANSEAKAPQKVVKGLLSEKIAIEENALSKRVESVKSAWANCTAESNVIHLGVPPKSESLYVEISGVSRVGSLKCVARVLERGRNPVDRRITWDFTSARPLGELLAGEEATIEKLWEKPAEDWESLVTACKKHILDAIRTDVVRRVTDPEFPKTLQAEERPHPLLSSLGSPPIPGELCGRRDVLVRDCWESLRNHLVNGGSLSTESRGRIDEARKHHDVRLFEYFGVADSGSFGGGFRDAVRRLTAASTSLDHLRTLFASDALWGRPDVGTLLANYAFAWMDCIYGDVPHGRSEWARPPSLKDVDTPYVKTRELANWIDQLAQALREPPTTPDQGSHFLRGDWILRELKDLTHVCSPPPYLPVFQELAACYPAIQDRWMAHSLVLRNQVPAKEWAELCVKASGYPLVASESEAEEGTLVTFYEALDQFTARHRPAVHFPATVESWIQYWTDLRVFLRDSRSPTGFAERVVTVTSEGVKDTTMTEHAIVEIEGLEQQLIAQGESVLRTFPWSWNRKAKVKMEFRGQESKLCGHYSPLRLYENPPGGAFAHLSFNFDRTVPTRPGARPVEPARSEWHVKPAR